MIRTLGLAGYQSSDQSNAEISSGELTITTGYVLVSGEGDSADTLDSVVIDATGIVLSDAIVGILLEMDGESITLTHTASPTTGEIRMQTGQNETVASGGVVQLMRKPDGTFIGVVLDDGS